MAEHLPRVIAWETTRRCVLRCKHCRGSARDENYAGELSTEECLKVIDSIAAFAKPILILTGGEPMARDDIYTLARHATDAGLRVVMAPCGHLITPETAERLKAAGVMAISISIDGATPEAHDAFRGVEGAYARTIEGLQHAIEAGIPFQVNTTVTRDNVGDLSAIHDLAVDLGASKFDVFFLVPTGRGSALSDLALQPAEAEDALKWVLKKSKTSPMSIKITCAPHSVRIWDQMEDGGTSPAMRGEGAPPPPHAANAQKWSRGALAPEHPGTAAGGRPPMSPATGCMAGDGFVFISHTGILQPCGFLDVASGDLRGVDLDFQRAYHESPVFASLWDKSGYEGKCGVCEFVDSCGGCRARAYAKTGDFLKTEPGCSYVPDRLKRGAHSQTMTDHDHNAWMTAVQRDIPLERRPFAVIGERFDMTEDEVISKLQALFDEGKARRIGGVFDVRGVGYRSALCAATVPEEALERHAAMLFPQPGMTHCYQRGWPEALSPGLPEVPPAGIPNLWFTLSAQGDAFDAT
ncbi:MAG: radical SAM protein, partial [Verrucomicrobia bacterium]|nr:radical SAM protein [Verrucomicrobiota bacterium]